MQTAKSDRTLSRTPVLPGDSEDVERRAQTRMRRRLMSGRWLSDLMEYIRDYFDDVREEALGKPDQSTNVLMSVINQLAVLYAQRALIKAEGVPDEAIKPLLDMVEKGGLWAMATRNQRSVLGMRENLIRASWVADPRAESKGKLMFRLITPDMVYGESPADSPDQPHYLVEARVRPYPKDKPEKQVWTWDSFDLRDPLNPRFQILLPNTDKKRAPDDLTEHYLGGPRDGAAYPYQSPTGPYIPYVVYHAERTGSLWDSWQGIEMVEGSIIIAVLWTLWGHCVRDASWAQKYAINLQLQGTKPKDKKGGGASWISMDATSIMMLRTMGDGSPGSIGQLSPAVNPDVLGKAISDFEARLSVHFGIGPDDMQRGGSGESGYAIAIKRESVRQHQRQYEPQFRDGDVRLMEICANLANTHGGGAFPVSGYTATYPGLPKTHQEIMDAIAEIEAMVNLGQASPVDIYMERHPGTSREDSMKELQRIRKETAQLSATAPILG